MISHINGQIAQIGDNFIVIDVGGIGYQVHVTATTLAELSNKNEKVKLYTYLNVREDALTLYGFLGESELSVFKLLISVTRVGPQIAMSILSQIKIEDLAAAIINEDEKVLTSISGVGTKNAKRLILELKDKMKKSMSGLKSTSSFHEDAIRALVSLGFEQRKAKEAVDSAFLDSKDASVEILIKAALSKLKER